MAYEPTNWKDGDLVTSAKLNKIEQGIADAISSPYFIVGDDPNNSWKLNRTYKEVEDAFLAGKIPIFVGYDEQNNFSYAVILKRINNSNFTVYFGDQEYYAYSENDYLTVPD